MSDVRAPNFGELLAPYLSSVPPEAMPRFLALLERGAAERYRHWAALLPEHHDVLASCAASEDEIADRIDAAFDLRSEHLPLIEAPLPAATATYYEVFDRLDVWDQLRIQADAERQGARAWRNIATRTDDPSLITALERCASLEEASAACLDTLIEHHAP
jgi:hypothetical protein